MYWHKEKKYRAGGRWRCRIQRSEVDSNLDKTLRRASQLRYWHKTGGGYVKRRRRELADQRAAIVNQLAELQREAA